MVALWRLKVLQNALNTFDLHQVIFGLENQVLVFFSGPLRFYCILFDFWKKNAA